MAVQGEYGVDGAGTDDGSSRTDVAKQQVAQVSGTVKEQGAAVTGTAKEGGQKVADEAKKQAGALTQQAQQQLSEVWGRSQSELSDRASEQTDKAAANLRGLSGELRALADGRPEDASRMVGYLHQVADRADHYSDRLDQDGFAGVADDLSRFARRRPGLFLLSAVAAGFAAGRLARGAQAARSSSEDEGPTALPSTGRQLTSSEPTPYPSSVAAPSGLEPATAADSEPLADVLPPAYLSGEADGPGVL